MQRCRLGTQLALGTGTHSCARAVQRSHPVPDKDAVGVHHGDPPVAVGIAFQTTWIPKDHTTIKNKLAGIQGKQEVVVANSVDC